MADFENTALLTDLYELTMAQAYFQSGKTGAASFSLFIRSYPKDRGYFIAAGLSDVLEFLGNFAFQPSDIDYLRSKQIFAADFLDYLKTVRFTGDVWAIPEGRVFFKDEPVLEITAPIIEAQLVETFVMNQVNLQSLIATKASRCVYAARGHGLVDFSLRRTHGTDAGMKVARASYLAGFVATSNVLAGKRYAIPISGTMAHSFVASFENELEAFRAYAASFPNNAILLIDTYDTLAGARNAVTVANEIALKGHRVQAVRIDSGDLPRLAAEVRRIFDAAGLPEVKIIGSGGLDEYELNELATKNAPYDSYGVGTQMGVSADAPSLDIAYKLVEYENRPVLKLSTGKASWPGVKQVFRFTDESGYLTKDIIALRNEEIAGTEPLLKIVMNDGRPVGRQPTLEESRSAFSDEFSRLPQSVKAISNPETYPVEFSPHLTALREEIERKITHAS